MNIKGEDLYKEIQNLIDEHIETKLVKTTFKNRGKYNPEKMFTCIAGGSVADRLFFHNTNIELPIKDIDIFVDATSSWDIDNPKEYNGVEYFINKKNNTRYYKIEDVVWDGKINIILVNVFEPCLNEEEFAQYVIRGFDLNSCQAAITMNNKTLFTTKSFEEFLETRDLKVTNPHNTGSTALRMIKKGKQLGYFNKEREFDILCSAFNYYKGKTYMAEYIQRGNPKTKYIDDIRSHFLVDDVGKEPYIKLLPKKEKDILNLDKFKDEQSIFQFNRKLLTIDEIREMYERKKKELQ